MPFGGSVICPPEVNPKGRPWRESISSNITSRSQSVWRCGSSGKKESNSSKSTFTSSESAISNQPASSLRRISKCPRILCLTRARKELNQVNILLLLFLLQSFLAIITAIYGSMVLPKGYYDRHICIGLGTKI